MFFAVHRPDNITPEFAIPVSIFLIVLFVLIVLVQNRRATIRRRARARFFRDAKRRESFIQVELEKDPIPDFVEGKQTFHDSRPNR